MLQFLRQIIMPRWPALDVQLVYRDSAIDVLRGEELGTVVERENFGYYTAAGRYDFMLYGGSLYKLAVLERPARLYTRDVFLFLGFWYSVLYTLIVLSTAVDAFTWLWREPVFIATVTALVVHILYNIKLAYTPTTKTITLLEFGETAEGIRVFVPAPYPFSELSLKEFYEITSRKTISVELFKKHGKELIATLNVLRAENEVLKIRNAKLLESYDEMEDRVLAEALSRVPKEILERERIAYKKNILILASLVVVISFISFALGFVIAGGAVAVVP